METPYSRTIIGNLTWYSVLIVCGILLAVYLAEKEEKRVGLPKDTVIDLCLVMIPCGIIGARLYFVFLSWDIYCMNPISALYIWNGGLAIYGGIIGGILSVWIMCKKRKLPFLRVMDCFMPGLILAQAIGRWGNYFNQEAFGPLITDERFCFFPFAVKIVRNSVTEWHAATFFYESFWNVCGFVLLWSMRKKRKTDGETFAWYWLIYSSGRFLIEQLRQDSLVIGNVRVSQWLSFAACVVAILFLLKPLRNRKVYYAFSILLLVRLICSQQLMFYLGIVLVACVFVANKLWKQLLHTSHVALILALCLDIFGVVVAFAIGHPIAYGIHMALCSITLCICIFAVQLEREINAEHTA